MLLLCCIALLFHSHIAKLHRQFLICGSLARSYTAGGLVWTQGELFLGPASQHGWKYTMNDWNQSVWLPKKGRLRWLGHVQHKHDSDRIKCYITMAIDGTRWRDLLESCIVTYVTSRERK